MRAVAGSPVISASRRCRSRSVPTCSTTPIEGVWTSSPRATLAVTVHKPEAVSTYAFGTRTATFHVCACCGVVPLVTSEIDNHVYAVVNVNALENVDPAWLRRAAASFEGEDVESRLARRKRNWIAKVRFADPGAGSK